MRRFKLLKERNAIHLAASGKNAGCWVMPAERCRGRRRMPSGSEDDDAKIIVRSNGTVTYVGKDIAYQLWKFGLLGRDFHYEKFHTYADGHALWSSVATGGDASAPTFGRASIVYNVIDARQAYLQNVVVAGLRALGFGAAGRPVHSLLLRNCGADAALRGRTRLHAQ